MEKMLNAMLNAQKEMVLEKNTIEVELEIVSGVLEEATYILQDLISRGRFEEAKGFLDDCSRLQQNQENLETLLADKQSDCSALEEMITEAKRFIAKYEIDETECEEKTASSLEDLLAALVFFSMK